MNTYEPLTGDSAARVQALSGVSPETDPDLAAIIDRFALAEILEHPELAGRHRHLVRIAGSLAAQGRLQFAANVSAALDDGVRPVEVKEVLYLGFPYLGSAMVVDFLALTNDLLVYRGVPLPLEPQATTGTGDRFEVGLALQKAIIGSDVIEGLYSAAPADEIHFQRALSANCSGDHLTRGALDVQTRELLIFSMLVTLGGADPQVRSHVGANFRVGNQRGDLLGALTQLLPFIGYPRTLNGLAAVNAVAPVA